MMFCLYLCTYQLFVKQCLFYCSRFLKTVFGSKINYPLLDIFYFKPIISLDFTCFLANKFSLWWVDYRKHPLLRWRVSGDAAHSPEEPASYKSHTNSWNLDGGISTIDYSSGKYLTAKSSLEVQTDKRSAVFFKSNNENVLQLEQKHTTIILTNPGSIVSFTFSPCLSRVCILFLRLLKQDSHQQ